MCCVLYKLSSMKERTRELWSRLFIDVGWHLILYLVLFAIFFRWMFPHGDFVKIMWFVMSVVFPGAGAKLIGYLVLICVILLSMMLANLCLRLVKLIVKLVRKVRRRLKGPSRRDFDKQTGKRKNDEDS